MAREISKFEDVMDSRDIIERIEELETLAEDGDIDEDNKAELEILKAVAEQADGYGDWKHGETLIRRSYFKEYAQQLADDIGAINSEASWPNNCIDWDRAARELEMDYTEIEFDGVPYLMRA